MPVSCGAMKTDDDVNFNGLLVTFLLQDTEFQAIAATLCIYQLNFLLLAHMPLYPNFILVQPINTGASSEITPTQPSTVSTGFATVEDKSTNVTSNATSPMNLTTTANITRATTKEPIKKTELNTRTEGEGPATEEAIPVFDPAKSVDLEVISGTASLKSSIEIFVIIWVCIIAVISD